MVWAAERSPPKRLNSFAEAQPPNITAYTANPAIAKKNKMPICQLLAPKVGLSGMIAKLAKAVNIAMAGASVNINLSANLGVQSSLKKIFSISATSCNEPCQPTRFGP